MRKRFVRRPSPAMVVALLALCLAATGTAIAGGKLKLGKNAVKTKNIKDGAVTEAKIGAGAVSVGKLAGSAKSIWLETNVGGTAIAHQSGGVTITADGTGQKVVDFGTNISTRGIAVTPYITLGETTAQYGRCIDIGCPAPFANSTSAIEVFTFDATTNTLANTGFTAAALP